MPVDPKALEAAAAAIWNTWRESPFGKETAPDGRPFLWEELVAAADTGKKPKLAEVMALSRLEASNAITAYLAAISETHAVVPRVAPDFIQKVSKVGMKAKELYEAFITAAEQPNAQ